MSDDHEFNPNDPAHCDACFKEGSARLLVNDVQPLDATKLIDREGWDCAKCGHRHAGLTLANICVGCPCPETSPATEEDAWIRIASQNAKDATDRLNNAEARIADLEDRVRFYEQHTDRQANELVATKVLCYRYAAKWREWAGWHKALAPKQCCETASDDFQSVADGQPFREHDAKV